MDEKPIDPGHSSTRNVLRAVGPLLALLGLGLATVGIVDFFRAFGGDGPPRYFWCAFLGLPLLGVGLMLTKLGYLGRLMRYRAHEAAPPARDTFNYMAQGTQEGIKTVAGAIGQGLKEGGLGPGGTATKIRCHKCNALHDAGARFCDQCGQAMEMAKPCPQCHEMK
ncbi:MAG TPA: zinc ribbon domain-containing protein [Sedimentisphaerales bacterium]|nr:zinc ribbon domain-containing protein [Sedimentisphaerales bacterium]HRS13169.1 zinc ribbon domain-containing protein [Sedimentisphaerales bacterium]HRV49954.1 zinc ribbon domain-containing protein [Sedimentisphaerales bacterium]